MSLENMTGSSTFLSVLNPSWPDGDTDAKQQGDDHLRGIKNVLLNTFGALASSVAAWVGAKNAGGTKITGVLSGALADDAATFLQAQTAWNKNANAGKITNLLTGTNATDAATVLQAQTAWNRDAGTGKITNLGAGTVASDAVRVDQVQGGLGSVACAVAATTGGGVATNRGARVLTCVKGAGNGTYNYTLAAGVAIAGVVAIPTAGAGFHCQLNGVPGALTFTVTTWATGNNTVLADQAHLVVVF